MQTTSLNPHDIVIGERHRALSDDAVDRLAASMADIGLRQPVTVRIVEEMIVDGHLTAGVPVLVTGGHRLAAAKKLGWQKIECIEIDGDEIAAELWEIAENLHRLDLTKEQRDAHIRRYAELLGKRIVTQNAQQLEPRTVGRPKSIRTQIAEATGLSVDTVRRALKPEPAAPVQANADAVTQPKPSRQPQHYDQPDEIASFDKATGVEAEKIVRAWESAGPEARALALERIGAVLVPARPSST